MARVLPIRSWEQLLLLLLTVVAISSTRLSTGNEAGGGPAIAPASGIPIRWADDNRKSVAAGVDVGHRVARASNGASDQSLVQRRNDGGGIGGAAGFRAATTTAAAAANVAATAARQPRFVQPNALFGFFGTLRSIKKLYDEQYNDTLVTLTSVRNTLGDQFTDTATTTRKPPTVTVAPGNSTMAMANGTTTTAKPEKYRISRQELGYILGKNYRGLRKLLRLELNDAANQTRITVKEYRRDFGRALSPYTIPKAINATTTDKS